MPDASHLLWKACSLGGWKVPATRGTAGHPRACFRHVLGADPRSRCYPSICDRTTNDRDTGCVAASRGAVVFRSVAEERRLTAKTPAKAGYTAFRGRHKGPFVIRQCSERRLGLFDRPDFRRPRKLSCGFAGWPALPPRCAGHPVSRCIGPPWWRSSSRRPAITAGSSTP